MTATRVAIAGVAESDLGRVTLAHGNGGVLSSQATLLLGDATTI